jgi:glycosyltransferase involved in cell wall biosynthesis
VPFVLSPRALTPLYNQESVIRAFALVRRALPDARLVLKYPGEPVPAPLGQLVSEVGAEDAVDIVGHLDAATMPVLYRAADVVVSVPSSDSSPATAWEALACARPVVVSDLPWARAELHDREDAWLSPIADDALAEALRTLLDDRRLANDMGMKGRELAQKTKDRRRQMRALDARYGSLIAAS